MTHGTLCLRTIYSIKRFRVHLTDLEYTSPPTRFGLVHVLEWFILARVCTYLACQALEEGDHHRRSGNQFERPGKCWNSHDHESYHALPNREYGDAREVVGCIF